MGIKIIHVSDTHLRPFNPEPGDILVHSGDALNYGHMNDLIRFREQLILISNNYKHIIFTPGNHDWIFQDEPNLSEEFLKERIPNLTVLHNQAAEILGLKFYGTADQPEFCNWAFNRPSEDLNKSYNNIPKYVEILITHCPAKGMRDVVLGESVGSLELAEVMPTLTNLKAHLFGHIHFSRGLDYINDIYYSNGAVTDERYMGGYKESIIELKDKDVLSET